MWLVGHPVPHRLKEGMKGKERCRVQMKVMTKNAVFKVFLQSKAARCHMSLFSFAARHTD